eukprot:CAMPEP_0194492732 /NCGR_PEP_ID=MMETSP0253-20130528/11182_1 /TAXON_ID=2966 /ORGANISM="Noctiluca scintillans" /LENGTH=50 /DNA_ID=CAMNT_0039333635 /DNA_START=262 /DNA_END=414 /DNA_ORIENTATION=+
MASLCHSDSPRNDNLELDLVDTCSSVLSHTDTPELDLFHVPLFCHLTSVG